MVLGNFINILSSDVSDMLVDSSAPRVNLLISYSSMTVPVSMWLLTADYNLSNMVSNKWPMVIDRRKSTPKSTSKSLVKRSS